MAMISLSSLPLAIWLTKTKLWQFADRKRPRPPLRKAA
jgi:hypothetical protein